MNLIHWNGRKGLYRFVSNYLSFNIIYNIKVNDMITWLDNDRGLHKLCTSVGKAKEDAEEDLRINLINYYADQLRLYSDIVGLTYEEVCRDVMLSEARRWTRIGDVENEFSAEMHYKLGNVFVYTTVRQSRFNKWHLRITDRSGYPIYQDDYLSFRAAKRSGLKYTRKFFSDMLGTLIEEMNILCNIIKSTNKGWDLDNETYKIKNKDMQSI